MSARLSIALPGFLLCLALHAQVRLDGPLRFTAQEDDARQVEGLAQPADATDLITLRQARSGALTWASVQGTHNALQLFLEPAQTDLSPGLFLRFVPALDNLGPVTLSVDGTEALPLLMPDGAPLKRGELQAGAVAHVVLAEGAFHLMGRARGTCPPGFLQVNDDLCIQADEGPSMLIFGAMQYCNQRGARLCAWDEYVHACLSLEGTLSQMFDNWEWIDDTSDHTHTSDQVGRWTCNSQRSVGSVDHPNNYGNVRCCHTLR